MSAGNPATQADWDKLTDNELDVLERKIAAKYLQIIPWGAVAWGLGNCCVWLALWPLVLMDIKGMGTRGL